jgi:hypothetical protein
MRIGRLNGIAKFRDDMVEGFRDPASSLSVFYRQLQENMMDQLICSEDGGSCGMIWLC